MPQISFNCSSLVGQQAHYQADWQQSVIAVNQFYQPLETFGSRFDVMVADIVQLGFVAVDIWTAGQLNWAWATPEHINIAYEALEKHHVQVASLGGEFGETRAEFDSACRMAVGIGTTLLSGTLPLLFEDRDYVVQQLREYDLKLAIENHPEKHPREMLDKMGDGADGLIGTTVDTGWYATRGYDAGQAIMDLKDYLLHVHLKDVLAGDDHMNTGYGKGIVDIQKCLTTLKAISYQGDVSAENHSTDHDPSDELRAGLQLISSALA